MQAYSVYFLITFHHFENLKALSLFSPFTYVKARTSEYATEKKLTALISVAV